MTKGVGLSPTIATLLLIIKIINWMGYKKLIRDLIPEKWLVVLKQEQAITYFVDAAYKGIVLQGPYGKTPKTKIGKNLVRKAIIEIMTYCSIYTVVMAEGMTIPERNYWLVIHYKIISSK